EVAEDVGETFPPDVAATVGCPTGAGRLGPGPAEPPELDPAEALQDPRPERSGGELLGRVGHQGGVEVVGRQDGAGIGDVDDAVGEVDGRTEVVALPDEHRADGEADADVGQQVVVGVGIGQRQADAGGGRDLLDDEHGFVADHLDDPAAEAGDDVVGDLLEPADHGGEVVLGEVLTEKGEADHVGEADGEDRAGARRDAAGPQEHGPPGGGLDVAPPDELEQAGHGGQGAAGHAGEGVGGQDAVVLRHRRHRPGDQLGLGDPGHRRSDDPGELQGHVDVGGPQLEHGLEQLDGFDVEVGEGGLVGGDVQEAEGTPEPLDQVEGEPGAVTDVLLGVLAGGGHQQLVDGQEVEDVVGHRPVDLLLGGPGVEQEPANVGQGGGPVRFATP